MEAFDESVHERDWYCPKWPLYGLVAILLGAVGISSAYLYRERRQTHELTAANQTLSTSVVQLQNQLMVLNQRIQQMEEVRTPRPTAATGARSHRTERPARVSKGTKQRASAEDPRFQQLQGQLSDQQMQLASTREDLNKTRDDLSGALNSTRDELSGSIARTADAAARP